MRHLFYWVLLGILGSVLFAACNHCTNLNLSFVPKPLATECRIIKHIAGETCVPIHPQRVITLSSNTLGNVLALGVKPIGATNEIYLDNSPKVKNRSVRDKTRGIKFIGTSEPNLETVLSLKPDLIIGLDWFKSIYPLLSKIAPTVLDESNYVAWEKHFSFVAKALGKQEVEKALWDRYYQRIEQLKLALGDRYKDKKISFVTFTSNQIHIDARNSFAAAILRDANLSRPDAQSIDSVYGSNPISLEELEKIDGDILFVTTYSRGANQFLEKNQQNPLWKTLKAVRENRVYYVDMMSWASGHTLGTDAVIDDLFKYLVNTP